MAVERIGKGVVDAAPVGPKDSYIWDRSLKGFGVKVTPAGRKIYILQYRTGGRGTPTKRLMLGVHGPMTADQARDEATRQRGAIAKGMDPAALKAAERQAPTVEVIADRFMKEHVSKRKPRTEAEYQRLLDKIILPVLGSKQVKDVRRSDISRLHHDMRKKPYEANRVLALLSKMFNLAESWDERPGNSNPCRHIERHPEEKREAMLSADDFARLAEALAAASGANSYALAAIKLLAFTGARLNEVLTLEWSWIDFDRGVARLPTSKTGAKTLFLPPPALEVLSRLERVSGNPHVIVGKKGGTSLVNLSKTWRVIRKAAGLEHIRIHDLRHAFASVAASSGHGLHVIGKMLGHTQAATTHRYSHLAADPVSAAAAAVANQIAASMSVKTDNVVSLQRPGSSG